jgi:hypothetical protein
MEPLNEALELIVSKSKRTLILLAILVIEKV